MALLRSQAAQLFLTLKKDPLSFKDHPYMPGMIDCTAPRKLYKCSRQVGKSVADCLELTVDPMFTNLPVKAMRSVYVSPSEKQAQQFSIEKLQPMIYESPRYRTMYTDNRSRRDVFLYTLSNGAQIYLRAAFKSADRVRGIPADKIVVDEIQDIVPAFLPDIISSALASRYNRVTTSGTPKALENFIEKDWLKSSMGEWAVPCHAHSPVFWNVNLGVGNIGKETLVCSNCGKPINAREGIWVDGQPNAMTKGFHINQLASVINSEDPEKWKQNIVANFEDWSEDKFYNEILGVSFGHFSQILSAAEMAACTSPNSTSRLFDTSRFYDKPPTTRCRWFAGVDWGSGREEGGFEDGKKKYASFTIMVIGTIDADGKFVVAHFKKFRGKETDPQFCVDYVIRKAREWGVKRVGVDSGYGWGPNEQLIRALGKNRVIKLLYSGNMAALTKWDNIAWQYTLNRSAFVSRMINLVKRRELVLPKGSEEMHKDFIALKSEYSQQSRRILYTHSQSEPDDTLHASIYCKFAADESRGIFISNNTV